MAKSLEPHKVIDLYGLRLAHPVYVVSCKIDKHDVLRAVLLRIEQFCAQLLVLYGIGKLSGCSPRTHGRLTLRRSTAFDGPGDGMVVHLVLLHFAQCLWACTDDLYVPTVDVEHVWTWVHST